MNLKEVERFAFFLKENRLEFLKPQLPLANTKPRDTKKSKKKKSNPFDFEEQYETWTPPKGQTGDGRTALNDKLGY